MYYSNGPIDLKCSTIKLRAKLIFVKAARKMLVKLTPEVNFTNLLAQRDNAPVVILQHQPFSFTNKIIAKFANTNILKIRSFYMI